LPIATFGLVLAAPGLLQILQLGVSSPTEVRLREQRSPATLPSFPSRLAEWGRLPSRLDDWYSDAFGGRAWLVRANGWLRYHLGSSVVPERIVVGEDGWLYLGKEWADPIQQRRGVDTLSASELEQWVAGVQARQAWLRARGILFLFVVAPDKVTIYPEHLPSWARSRRGRTPRQKIVQRLRRAGIPVVDPTRALRDAKATAPVYPKTDSHWNDFGAFVAYREIARYLKEYPGFSGLANLAEQPYEVLTRSCDGQSMALQLGLEPGDIVDHDVSVILRGEPQVAVYDAQGERLQGGNRRVPRLALWTARSEFGDAPTALVLRDSFTTRLSPYLNATFGETTYAHYQSAVGRELTAAVDRHEPDLVLLIRVERDLKRLEPIHPSWAPSRDGSPRERFDAARHRVLAETGMRLSRRIARAVMSQWSGAEGQVVRAEPGNLLVLRPVAVEGQGPFLVRLDVFADVMTQVDIRHRGGDGRLKTVPFPLWPGPNRVYLEVPGDGLRQPLRLTFGRAEDASSGSPSRRGAMIALRGFEVRR